MSVVTRFAPSPTGFLHLGSARTALFNWLFARHHDGKFVLRVEDTDRARSTQEAIDKILDGLNWLGLDWDGETVFQASRIEMHQAAAQKLLDQGRAYYCYCTPEELDEMRELARKEGRPVRYDGRWRDRPESDRPSDIDPVVRLKAPLEGATAIEDQVQGRVEIANQQLDDMVLLRSDGTPTYMLSVVVDDIDMGITHVIRGDDHLTNAVRQTLLYNALDAQTPIFAHIPLIHGSDGAKLSKRHGATGVEWYRDQGILAEAMRNYLLRLGWSHGDDEIISTQQAIEWFELDAIGKSPSRFDTDKLDNLNAHYLRTGEQGEIISKMLPFMEPILGHTVDGQAVKRIETGLEGLTKRAKRLTDLAENAAFFARARPIPMDETANRLVSEAPDNLIQDAKVSLEAIETWDEESIEQCLRTFAETRELKLGKVAQPLRAALTGAKSSPGIFEVLFALGREESLARLGDAILMRSELVDVGGTA